MKLEELARLAGVSKATASIILNGRAEQYRISKVTQGRVTTLAKKYQYVANVQVAGSRNHTSKLVALIVPELTHRGFADFAKAVEVRLRKMGYQLLVSCSEDNPDIETKALSALTGLQVDAIITASSHSNDHMYRTVTNEQVPVIMIDRKVPTLLYSHIISNDKSMAQQLTEQLLQKAQHPPIFFGGIATMSNSLQRVDGFKEALQMAGLTANADDILHQGYTAQAGYNMMAAYFHQHNSIPGNLLTASFTLMEGVLGFVREHLSHLPQKPNWATFGNHLILDLLPFPIHSAPLNYTTMADHTVTLLKCSFQGETKQQAIVLHRDIILR